MGRRRRKQVGHSSDIAFLLIIFFLVLVGSTVDRAFSIDPTPKEEPSAQEAVGDDRIHIELLRDGVMQPVSSPGGQLSSLVAGQAVVLHVQTGVKWAQVVDALDSLSSWNVRSVGFGDSDGAYQAELQEEP